MTVKHEIAGHYHLGMKAAVMIAPEAPKCNPLRSASVMSVSKVATKHTLNWLASLGLVS